MQLPSPVGASPSVPSPVNPLAGLSGLPGVIAGGANSAVVAQGAVVFVGIAAPTLGTPEAAKQAPIASSLSLSNLVIVTNGVQPAGQSLTVTVRKNGVNMPLSVVIPANAPAGVYQGSGQAQFSSGDLFSVSFFQQAGAASSATIAGWAVS